MTTAAVTGGRHTPRQRTQVTPKPKPYPVVCAHASPKASTLLVGNIAAKGESPPRQVRSAHFALPIFLVTQASNNHTLLKLDISWGERSLVGQGRVMEFSGEMEIVRIFSERAPTTPRSQGETGKDKSG